MISKIRATTGVAATLSALVAGCSSPPPPPPPPPEPPPRAQLTTREVCESFGNLLTEQLGAINIESGPENKGPFYDRPVVFPVCPLTSSVEEDSPYGSLSINEMGKDRNPVGSVKPRGTETIVDGETVWFFDESTTNPLLPLASVEIATKVDGWFGDLEINPKVIPTADGFMEFTEADREVVSRYLVETVRKAAATNAN